MNRKIILLVTLLKVVTMLSLSLMPAMAGGTLPPQTLSSTTPEALGTYGCSVAVGGGYIVVGARNEYATYLYAGRVHIYDAVGTLVTTLTSPNTERGGWFGYSVAIGGGHVFVGAPLETCTDYWEAGRVYIYNTEDWELTATLTSPNAYFDGSFGRSVATDGTNLVVGAPGEYFDGINAGRAYVFTIDGSYISTLTSQSPEAWGEFGSSVAINGGYIAIGAPRETVITGTRIGRVYIYTVSETSVSYIKTLASQYEPSLGFGLSVAIGGGYIIVGAPNDSISRAIYAGRVYVYHATGEIDLAAVLTSKKKQDIGRFGCSVAIDGVNAVVGAYGETNRGKDEAGRVYVFDVGTATMTTILSSPIKQAYGYFGSSAAISGGTIVVGAPGETNSGSLYDGKAYIFS